MTKMNGLRLIMTLVLSGLMTASVMAVPAYRGWRTVEQPDGTEIKIRQVGDEFYHYTLNEAGERIKQNAEGFYEVVGEEPTATEFHARRAKSVARRQRKTVGTTPNLAPKGIVILANFKGTTMDVAHTREVFDELCNATNCTVNNGYGSAAQYFADQSNGGYRPQFDVFGPVTLSKAVSYYGKDKPGEDEGDDQHATDAVVEACILANEQYSTLNFADYDSDNDGYVDFVYVIYAGKGQADGGSEETIWPHNWEVESAIYYGYCTYSASDCEIDGKKLNNYAMSAELSGSSLSGIGTLCHEFGHVIGLPDLYDTNYGTNYKNYLTPNEWNIMDGGSYNGDGHCPPNYDPWEKYFFGWTTPENLGTEGKDITLKANGTADYKTYQINSANTLQKATKEGLNYYVENRQKSGWDKYVPAAGMVVWKVNFSSSAWENNSPNNTANNPRYTLLIPSGTKIGKNYGDKNVYPYSTIDSCKPFNSNKMTAIKRSGNDITFKYNGGNMKTECTYEVMDLADPAEASTISSEDGKINSKQTLTLTITPPAGYTLAYEDCWAITMGNVDMIFGENYTYDPATNKLTIPNVVDDLVIMLQALKEFSIEWIVKGELFATTKSVGSIELPEGTPAGCGDGKVFVGWCKESDYADASTAPTIVDDGNHATAGDKFYAVFAYEQAGGAVVQNKYTFTSKEWKDATNSWTSTKDGFQYSTTNNGVQVTNSFSGAGAKTSKSFDNVSSVIVTYCTNSRSGAGSITVKIGSTSQIESINAPSAGGNTMRTLEFDFDGASGAAAFQVNCTTNSIYIQSIAITSGGGLAYSDYSTSCAACDKILTIVKGSAAHGSFALSREGAIETCGASVQISVRDIQPATGYRFKEIVQTGINSGVTISEQNQRITYDKRTEGTSTINVIFEEKTTNIIRFYADGQKISEQEVEEGAKPELPDVTCACQSHTFVGWSVVEVEATKEPVSLVNDFTAKEDKDYYAVYSYSQETTGGMTAGVSFKKSEKDSTVDLSSTGKIYTIINQEIGISSIDGTKVYAGIDGAKIGTSKATGKINLTLSKAVTTNVIKVTARKYSSDSGRLKVTANGNEFGVAQPSGNESELTFTYSTPVDVNKVTVETTSKRAYIAAITIGNGSTVTTYYSSSVDCTATGIEEVRSETNDVVRSKKILIDGQLYILYNNDIYTITGTRVK